MADTISLPDNLKSRIARAYIANRSFTGDDGKSVDYKRCVLSGLINGQEVDIEVKIDKKDLLLLSLFEVVDQPQLGQE